MKPVILEREFYLKVPRGQLWLVLGDTDRLNRAQGLPPVTYHVLPRTDGSLEVEGEFRLAGMRIRWVEYPFEWVEDRRHFVVRRYRNGPLREFRGGLTLADSNGGTQVTLRAELHPRNALVWLAARLVAPRLGRGFERLCRAAETQVLAEQPVVLPGEAPENGEKIRRQLARVLHAQAAAGVLRQDDPLLALLTGYLATAPDRDVARIRPFALARRWNRPGMDVLCLCLRATRAGLLELTWDVICPGCRGAKERFTSLSGLSAEGHCDTCQIRFDLNFDQAVEVSFRPHPQIRKVEEHRFCAFGPGNTPHVLAQLRLEAGGRVEETLALPEGRYRLRSPEAPAATWVDAVEEGAGAAAAGVPLSRSAVFRICPEGTETSAPRLAAGRAAVTAENTLPKPARLILERAEWAQDAATAAVVSAVQEFRDLFSTEALSPDTQLRISSLTFLFTDLKGSTALYAELGDARAYALVRDHFTFLTEAVRRFEGAIVKTIGDAIMAVFQDAHHAVACAVAVQKDVVEFNRSHPPGSLVVKMGVHSGPCLAVRLNDLLDYFGSTVNLASRVQHLSEGGDILITEAVGRDAAVGALLEEERLAAEELSVELKGLGCCFVVWRLWPAARTAPPAEGRADY